MQTWSCTKIRRPRALPLLCQQGVTDRKHVGAPGGQVDEQTVCREVRACPVVSFVVDRVLEAVGLVAGGLERETQFRLTWMIREIHGYDQLFGGMLPGECYEALVRPVAVPCRAAFQQSPVAISDRRML